MAIKNNYDAIVVGSGITGGWAAKELSEKGLKVLLLERGGNVRHGVDYKTEHKPPWEFTYRDQGDRKLFNDEYKIQKQYRRRDNPKQRYDQKYTINNQGRNNGGFTNIDQVPNTGIAIHTAVETKKVKYG